MSFRAAFLSRARVQLTAIGRWWRANRPENPGLFRRETREAVGQIKSLPESGEAVDDLRLGVRRVLLPRTRYYLYYQVDLEHKVIEILSVWHTSRGSEPPL